jgi:hypothetical protein
MLHWRRVHPRDGWLKNAHLLHIRSRQPAAQRETRQQYLQEWCAKTERG